MVSDSSPPSAAASESDPGVRIILGDRRWGDSIEKRSATLAAARRWTGGLTFAGGATLIWAVIFPRPYAVVMAILLLLPIVSLLQLVRFKGLVRWDGKRGTPYPDVIVPCFVPVVGLLMRDFKAPLPTQWLPITIPIIGLTLVLMAVLWVCARDVRAKASRMAVAAGFALTYSAGAMLHINAQYFTFF